MRHIGIINLPVTILKEGKQFVAYTPALDLSTSGKTYVNLDNVSVNGDVVGAPNANGAN